MPGISATGQPGAPANGRSERPVVADSPPPAAAPSTSSTCSSNLVGRIGLEGRSSPTPRCVAKCSAKARSNSSNCSRSVRTAETASRRTSFSAASNSCSACSTRNSMVSANSTNSASFARSTSRCFSARPTSSAVHAANAVAAPAKAEETTMPPLCVNVANTTNKSTTPAHNAHAQPGGRRRVTTAPGAIESSWSSCSLRPTTGPERARARSRTAGPNAQASSATGHYINWSKSPTAGMAAGTFAGGGAHFGHSGASPAQPFISTLASPRQSAVGLPRP